jgi:hypothetical protein
MSLLRSGVDTRVNEKYLNRNAEYLQEAIVWAIHSLENSKRLLAIALQKLLIGAEPSSVCRARVVASRVWPLRHQESAEQARDMLFHRTRIRMLIR